MQFKVLGFPVVPKTPLGQWILCLAFVLLGLAFLVHSVQVQGEIRQRVERIAGFDMPDDMEYDWQTRPRRRQIGRDRIWSQGYRLPQDLAQELMHTCVQRGGFIMQRDEAVASYPELDGRVSASSPACIRSESGPTRAVSMLQEGQLIVRIHR